MSKQIALIVVAVILALNGKIGGGTKVTGGKVNHRDGLSYVWIHPGKFQMGCSPGDNECYDSEKPTHSVTITKGFWMGQTPVTQAAYRHVTGANPSHVQYEQHPVVSVTWFDASDYCAAVGMRLPTEAEWEYAARAGSRGSRYGDLDAIAWYDGNSNDQMHDVAQKQPNAWKLYDMLGEVEQWTADWYGEYSQTPVENPHGPNSGGDFGPVKVLRGGGAFGHSSFARASNRSLDLQVSESPSRGFRCAGESLP
jgi:formylglycine-generating enzyme required for sulfatase activity